MKEIIDFHTHPYSDINESIKRYKCNEDYRIGFIIDEMNRAGITRFCGSVINRSGKDNLENMRLSNEHALDLAAASNGSYLPGIHIHPDYIEESIEEINNAVKSGVRLIGELVPYIMGWKEYSYTGCYEIFGYAQSLGMVVNCHPTNFEDMEQFASSLPHLPIVYAHPGEAESVSNYAQLMKRHDNVYLDISGTGIFRYGLLRFLIDSVGKERIIFGSDYPVCNPGVYTGGLCYERLTSEEQDYILFKNAKRLLNL